MPHSASDFHHSPEARLKALFEHAPDPNLVTREDGRIENANLAAHELFGVSQPGLEGQSLGTLVVPDSAAAFAAISEQLMATGAVRLADLQMAGLGREGFAAEVSAVAERDASGAAWQRWSIRDVSARKPMHLQTGSQRAEEALERSEATLRATIEASLDIVEMLDEEGRFKWLSRSVTRVLGYAPEELIGLRLVDVVHPEDAPIVERAFTRASEQDTDIAFAYRGRHREGRWVDLEARGSWAIDGETFLVLVVRDMTAQVALVARLEAARAEANRANQAKSEFLSRMSHELRTPLNAILGFGQLLQMELDRESDREGVEQILRAGDHLLALIDEVLDVARIEAGRANLSVEPIVVSDLVEESLALVRQAAAARGITIWVAPSVSQEHIVWGDQQRLKQVLLNLLSNAIKYNRESGTVALSCEPEGERLRISVADSGRGISADKLARLFTPFDRLGREQSGVQGTGLGLTLSRALVEAMQGKLGVESQEGRGSTFWLDLPRLEVKGSELAPVRPPEAANEARTCATVLLVEDNLANSRLITNLLERSKGVRLVAAMQGRRAVELAREIRPDLVLLDLNLPDISGEEVLGQLQNDPALWMVPVVMMSGAASEDDVERLLAR
ncbi:MAG: PAS domain S-box protein, partial [Gemmatimonadetes bacterium]|nr:PAS domain S-box protein [Gemmatimonadota bacterium]